MDGGFAEHYAAFNDEEEEQHYHGETEQGQRTQNFNDVDDSGGNDNDHRRGGDSSAGKLFVGGLAWETTEGAFTNYFSKYGEVVDSVIMLDKISGRPRGFGFVTFADPVVADKVLEEEHVIDGRPVEVKRTVPREEMQVKGVQRTRKIFVGGIPPSFTEDELKEYFSSYGIVAEHQIMFDRETGRSRGFGFVTFQDEETVERIVSDGNIHELGGKEVEIKKAVPKRAGGDFNYDSRPRHGGSGSKSYGGFGGEVGDYRGGRGGAGEYGGGRGGKSSRGYGAYAGGAYGGYGGNYGGAAAAAAAGFYGGYGGYGYGFGYWGPMYNGGYGAGGFGPTGGYGGAGAMAGYGGGGGVGAGAGGAGYGGGKGYGSGGGGGGGGGGSGGGGSGYAGGKGYSSSGGGSGGKGYGNGGAASGRYHPY